MNLFKLKRIEIAQLNHHLIKIKFYVLFSSLLLCQNIDLKFNTSDNTWVVYSIIHNNVSHVYNYVQLNSFSEIYDYVEQLQDIDVLL